MELEFTVLYNMESFCFCSNLKALADDLPRRTTHGWRTKCWWQRPPCLQMSVGLPPSNPSVSSLLTPWCYLPDRWLLGSIQTPYLAGCFLWWWLHAGLCLAGCVHARTQPHGPARGPQCQTCHSFFQWIWPVGLHLGAQHRNNSWTIAEIPRSADQGMKLENNLIVQLPSQGRNSLQKWLLTFLVAWRILRKIQPLLQEKSTYLPPPFYP